MVRRPLLEPNLSASGLTFTGVALLVFLMANVMTTKINESDLAAPGAGTGPRPPGGAAGRRAWRSTGRATRCSTPSPISRDA